MRYTVVVNSKCNGLFFIIIADFIVINSKGSTLVFGTLRNILYVKPFYVLTPMAVI